MAITHMHKEWGSMWTLLDFLYTSFTT